LILITWGLSKTVRYDRGTGHGRFVLTSTVGYREACLTKGPLKAHP
jgi:hypothetical protein